MRGTIMAKTNELLRLLNVCRDEELADEVCARVSCNEPFDDDDVTAALADETDDFEEDPDD